jgi:hypothetical protein
MRLASPRRWMQPSYVPAFVPLPSVASRSARSGDPFNQQPNSQSLRSAPSSDRWCAARTARIKRRKTVCRSLFHWATAACLVVRLLAPKQSNKQCVASLVVGYSTILRAHGFRATAALTFSPFGETRSASSQIPSPSGLLRLIVLSLRAVLESRSEDRLPLLCSLGPQPASWRSPAKSNQITRRCFSRRWIQPILRAQLSCHCPASQHISRSERPAQPAARIPSASGLLRLIVGALSLRAVLESRRKTVCRSLCSPRPTAACLVVRLPN